MIPEQKTKNRTMSYRYPGKREMGWVSEGFPFIPLDEQNSEGGIPYYAITQTKWVAKSACEPINVVPPPPVDPPPVPSKKIINIRTSYDGGITYPESETFESVE